MIQMNASPIHETGAVQGYYSDQSHQQQHALAQAAMMRTAVAGGPFAAQPHEIAAWQTAGAAPVPMHFAATHPAQLAADPPLAQTGRGGTVYPDRGSPDRAEPWTAGCHSARNRGPRFRAPEGPRKTVEPRGFWRRPRRQCNCRCNGGSGSGGGAGGGGGGSVTSRLNPIRAPAALDANSCPLP